MDVYNTYDFTVAHPDHFKQLAVKDMLFAFYKCPQVDKHLQLFTHYNEIAYTLRGKKTLHHGNKSWELTDNSALFIRRTAYKQQLHESIGWEILAFYFQDEFLRKVFREFRDYLPADRIPEATKNMIIEIKVNEVTKAFFYSIVPYFTQSTSPAESLLELKFKELLFNILSDPANVGFLAYVNSIVDQIKTPLWEVMEANYTYNLTVAEFARMSQRSVAVFKREFYEYYHDTPGKWLTKRRLEHSRKLLNTSKKNIGEISSDSGFENVSHFSRIFKENFGISPLQYRKKQFPLEFDGIASESRTSFQA